MKTFISCGCALLAATISLGAPQPFHGMVATYNGTGLLKIKTEGADYVYTLRIEGSDPFSPGSLSIKPEISGEPLDVRIDSIQCDGGLSSLSITFPPGSTCAGYVRSLDIAGDLGTIKIVGGDLGSSDAHDGLVSIEGSLGSLYISGKSYTVGDTNLVQWWGGNCWADIAVIGSIGKISTKGGNLYHRVDGGLVGTITAQNGIGQIIAMGATVKTNSSSSVGRMFCGGGIAAYIDAGSSVGIREIKSQGGIIDASKISCVQLLKLTASGQKAGLPTSVPASSQGIFRTYVAIRRATEAEKEVPADLGLVSIKNGVMRDSLFGVRDSVKSISLTGEPGYGLVSNVVVRSGCDDDLSAGNGTPYVYPATVFSTSVYAGTGIVLPFRFRGEPNEELTVRLHYRDSALGAFLSNDVGQVFHGTNIWRTPASSTSAFTVVTNTVITNMVVDTNVVVVTNVTIVTNVAYHIFTNYGYIVWATPTNAMIGASNVVIRVSDNRIPGKYSDVRIRMTATSNAIPVRLIVDPPDATRTNAVGTMVSWRLSVDNPLLHPSLTYSIGGMSAFSLKMYLIQSGGETYAITTNALIAGTYPDIQFSVDTGFFSDGKTVELCLTGTWAVAMLADAAHPVPPDTRSRSAAPAVKATTTKTNIGKISTSGETHDSMFVADAEAIDNAWAGVTPSASIKTLKVSGYARGNTFVSLKKMVVSDGDEFDFTNNFIWINGNLMTNYYQMKGL